MGLTPGNPILGGDVLRRAAIVSPNFNEANPTASPTPSWGILQSGLAYFFGLVLAGGTITGPDYIFNSQGLFFYNGTPGAGNLIAWFAPAAGVDQFGNPFTEGLNVGGAGQNIALIPQVNSAFQVTTTLAGILEAAATLGSGDVSQVVAGVLGSMLIGTGTATKQTTALGSPIGAGSSAYILLESQNDAGTDTPVLTFGTVKTPDGGTTLVFSPIMTIGPFYFLLYSGASGQTVVTKTSGSGNIPIPVGVATALGESWGAAASGGGGSNANTGSGGGGGEYAAEPALAVTGGGNVAYVVGAGGAAATGNVNGHDGGDSTLTGSAATVTGHGGKHGTSIISSSTTPGGLGGTGSANTTHHDGGHGGANDINSDGGGGGSSAGPTAAGNPGSPGTGSAGGAGGAAPAGGGAGGKGGTFGASGAAGSAPGGASGGAGSTIGPNTTSPAAPNGQVRLTYSTGAPTILLSAAASAGTDQFGTAYPAGMLLATPAAWGSPVSSNIDAAGSVNLGDQAADLAATTGASRLYSLAGHEKYASPDGTKYTNGHFTSFSTTDEPVNSLVYATVCGGGMSVAAGRKYRVHAELTVVQGPNVAANNFRLGFTGTISQVRTKIVSGQDATNMFLATTTGNNATLATHAWGAGSTYTLTLHAIISVTSTGTLSIQAQMSAAADTFTVLALSDFHVEPIG
jgi:hypothetical protein